MTFDLSKRNCGIWDLDNTLYPDTHPDGFCFADHYLRAFADMARATFPTLSDEDILHYREIGYTHLGASFLGFDEVARDHGYDFEAIHDALHEQVNLLWFERIIQSHPDRIRPCPDTVSLFESLSSHLRHGCLTHSSIKNWGRPVLERLDIVQFFGPILGMPDYDFMSKHLSTRGLEKILDLMDADPPEAFFVEDTIRNLEKVKDLDSRLLTVLVHHGRPPDRLPSCVDIAVESPKILLSALHKAHMSAKPRSALSAGPIVPEMV